MLKLILTPIAFYTLFFFLQFLPFRLFEVKNRTRVISLVLLVCSPAIYPLYHFFVGTDAIIGNFDWFFLLVFVALLFTLLWCGYVQFVFSFDTSPSLRFLIEIMESEDAGELVDENGLARKFSFDEVFQRRMNRMVEGGALRRWIQADQTLVSNSPFANVLGRMGDFLKRFMKLGDGG